MSNWQLVGPKIPHRVWRNHLLVARGFDSKIVWGRLRPSDLGHLREAERAARPTLLVLHGTGLRTRMGLSGICQRDFKLLQDLYGPRILAFEHRAVRHRLDRNACSLVRHLESLGVGLRLHLLGLSRGGLLARMLVEGWIPCAPRIRINKVIFLGTPNEGSLSARWDRSVPEEMKIWRQDIRRLLLVNRGDAPGPACLEPYLLQNHELRGQRLRAWPLLDGTGDQIPGSEWLDRLNGFSGPAHHTTSGDDCRYYALASVFNFEHGAPNPVTRLEKSWRDITQGVFASTPNDLVVPTAGVYQPKQGEHACGRFPIRPERLLVLAPECNATHIGMLRLPMVRAQMLAWLRDMD